MGIFSGLFKSRDKPQNRTTGSNYAFFFGGTASGKIEKIDGAVAMIMALDRAIRCGNNKASPSMTVGACCSSDNAKTVEYQKFLHSNAKT